MAKARRGIGQYHVNVAMKVVLTLYGARRGAFYGRPLKDMDQSNRVMAKSKSNQILQRESGTVIPKDCGRLVEVDSPIAEVSQHAAREKSIRHGHPSTLHLWWTRRLLESSRKAGIAPPAHHRDWVNNRAGSDTTVWQGGGFKHHRDLQRQRCFIGLVCIQWIATAIPTYCLYRWRSDGSPD